jgi:tyrosine-protein kinase Etk/Wzc
MSRRKFNLGDIIRKLNEDENSTAPEKPPSQPAEVPPRTASPRRTETSPVAGAMIRQPPPEPMPVQPTSTRPPMHNQASALPTPITPPANAVADSSETIPHSPSGPKPRPIPPPVSVNRAENVRPAPAHPNANAPGGDEEEEEEEFNIYKYIGILLRRKYVVLLIAAAATLMSIFRYLNSDSYYIASARLLFRPDLQGIITDQNTFRYWGDRDKIFNTHIELLKSHTVLATVSRNLGGKVPPDALGGLVSIKQGETNGEKNDVIEITCRYRSADTARDILNELCRTYIDYRRGVNSQEISRLVEKFEFQIDKIQNELSKKESALREFKESHRMVELNNETNATIRKLADMESAHEQTQLALLETRERLNALNAQINTQEHDVVQSVTYQDPFRNRIAALELELNTLTTEYSPEHFKVKMLRQQIENLKATTVDSISREAESRTLIKNPIRQVLLQDLVNQTVEKSALEAKRIAQEQLIERFNQELIRLPAVEQQYAFLQRETGSLLQTLAMLKAKYEETKIKRDSEESDLKILELAQTPESRISTVKTSNIILGIIIGLILGIALALLIEYLDQTLKDPASVEKTLGVPLLGIVPFIEADNAILEQATDLTKNILEPFRALRANLKHIAATHHLQTFIICSAIKGEGKTTLAANLGITFALDGKKVILVDADLRRSQAHSLFAIPKQTGLTDYLLGTATADEIIKPTRFDNMSVITSGERPHNPAELLGTHLFDHLVEELRTKADIIIFDSPALLPVSDTITMAPKMDGVLFVVRTFWTPLKAAKQALNQLQRIGSHLYGGILNGASHSGKYYPYYYGYYGYYGYYSYKYAYEEDHKKPFSVREAGLRIERSIREQLTALRYALPKSGAELAQGLNRLARKKMLWLLVICLCIITVSRIVIEHNAPPTIKPLIEYVGINGSATSGKNFSAGNDTFAPPQARIHSAAGIPVQSRANEWFNAFAQRKRDAYLSFYDKVSFRFSGGGYPAWYEATENAFNQAPDAAIIELDSIRTIASDSSNASLQTFLKAITGSDTLRGCIATQWNLGSDHAWRIIGQETISGHLGQMGVYP